MRVLIIKLTSMGDLMHALPALSDAAQAIDGIQFDWVVDEAFSDVPLWHPAVHRVIKTSHRRWRKNAIKTVFGGEFSSFRRQLNEQQYDVVIDLQNNIKSATVSWLVKAEVHGLDKNSCREYPAHWAYKYHYRVNTQAHAIERIRDILSQALAYERSEEAADYGVDFKPYPLPDLDFKLPKRYLVFVHNASWLTKLWPLEHWQALIQRAAEQGYEVLLPCGNDEEYQRAQHIASISSTAFALPKLSLNEMAAIMQHAVAAVCSDTGLAHLAAVAGTPALTLYGATETGLIGTYGDKQAHQVSKLPCTPCYKRRCELAESVNGEPICMSELTVPAVWDRLEAILPSQ